MTSRHRNSQVDHSLMWLCEVAGCKLKAWFMQIDFGVLFQFPHKAQIEKVFLTIKSFVKNWTCLQAVVLP